MALSALRSCRREGYPSPLALAGHPLKDTPWGPGMGLQAEGPAGFRDQVKVTPSWEAPGCSRSPSLPPATRPRHVATRISMMTRGSTKAVRGLLTLLQTRPGPVRVRAGEWQLRRARVSPFPVCSGSVSRLGGSTSREPWIWRGLLSEGLGSDYFLQVVTIQPRPPPPSQG